MTALCAKVGYETRLLARWTYHRDTLHRGFTAHTLRIKCRRDRFHAESFSAPPDIALSNIAHLKSGHCSFQLRPLGSNPASTRVSMRTFHASSGSGATWNALNLLILLCCSTCSMCSI